MPNLSGVFGIIKKLYFSNTGEILACPSTSPGLQGDAIKQEDLRSKKLRAHVNQPTFIYNKSLPKSQDLYGQMAKTCKENP